MSFDGALNRNPNGLRARGPEGATPMWKRTTLTISVKVNLAACLFGVAAILKILM